MNISRFGNRGWVSAAALVLALGCGSTGGSKKKGDATSGSAATDGTSATGDTSGTDGTPIGDGSDATTGGSDTSGAGGSDTVSPTGNDTTSGPDMDVVQPTPDTSMPDMDIVGPADTSTGDPDVAAAYCEVAPEIATFLTSKCGPGCHTGGSQKAGVNLDPASVLTSGAISPGNSGQSAAMQAINNGTMPPGGGLSAAQKQALADWINSLDCGGGTTDPGVDNGPAVGMPAGCAIGGSTVECNPITNNGCAGAGQACDLIQDGGLACFDPPNDVVEGGACDNQNGPFCSPGMHCGEDSACHLFCCANSDCASAATGTHTCTPFDGTLGSIGVCL